MLNDYIQNIEQFKSYMDQNNMNYDQAKQSIGADMADSEFDSAVRDGSWRQLITPTSAEESFRDVTGGLLELSGVMQPSAPIEADVPAPRGTGQFENPMMMDPSMPMAQPVEQPVEQPMQQPMPNISGEPMEPQL
jgi:hypothetical protein